MKGGNEKRLRQLERWHHSGGLLIIGYEMYRNLCLGKRVRDRETRERFRKMLRDPGPDVVLCDEGHVLRNYDSQLSQCMNQIRTLRRIVLTGTPLQNNLNECTTFRSQIYRLFKCLQIKIIPW